MRDGESVGFERQVIIEQYIQIDDSVGVGLTVLSLVPAPHNPLNMLSDLQQLNRLQFCLHHSHRIGEGVLTLEAPRFTNDVVRGIEHLSNFALQQLNCGIEVMRAIAEVATQADVNQMAQFYFSIINYNS